MPRRRLFDTKTIVTASNQFARVSAQVVRAINSGEFGEMVKAHGALSEFLADQEALLAGTSLVTFNRDEGYWVAQCQDCGHTTEHLPDNDRGVFVCCNKEDH